MRVKLGTALVKFAKPDDVELTLTVTLPVHAWKRVRDGQHWNPFSDAVSSAISRVESISTTQREIEDGE